jgi:hypothetical protein
MDLGRLFRGEMHWSTYFVMAKSVAMATVLGLPGNICRVQTGQYVLQLRL